jgi:hypothetical protein
MVRGSKQPSFDFAQSQVFNFGYLFPRPRAFYEQKAGRLWVVM